MSTYCHRIIEYLNKDNQWVRVGERVDNFHGFDFWRNNDYYDRGFPENHTIKKEEIYDEEEDREFVWGKSYITLSELSSWADTEYEEALSSLHSYIQNGLFKKINLKLNDIESYISQQTPRLPPDEMEKAEKEIDEEDDIISNYSNFKEYIEEVFEQYRWLNSEIIAASSLVENVANKNEEYWIELDKIRIVFYFD